MLLFWEQSNSTPKIPKRWNFVLRIISKKKLRDFWDTHSDAKEALDAWHSEVRKEDWKNSAEIKAGYGSAKIIKADRAVFKIKGNKYRLVTAINYTRGIVYIRFVGTHAEYERVDAKDV